MRSLRVLPLLFLLCVVGCGAYEVVPEDDYNVAQKVKSGQYELVKKDELSQLRQDAQIGKSVGRYQIYRSGFRTWRLDTATGRTCILLTTDDDWKKPDITLSSCSVG
jgi:hypothetical protein